MKKHIENYDVFKETISKNNVLAMAEQLAMYETRFLIGYMGAKMQKIYSDAIVFCSLPVTRGVITAKSISFLSWCGCIWHTLTFLGRHA